MAILFLNKSCRPYRKNRSTSYATKKNRAHPEQDIQITFFELLELHPNIWRHAFHIPNGGSRGGGKVIVGKDGRPIKSAVIEGKKFKRMGVKKGVPDIFIALPVNGYHGVFIEMKAPGEKLSPDQESMIINLRCNGYLCLVFCCAFEAIDAVLTLYKNANI